MYAYHKKCILYKAYIYMKYAHTCVTIIVNTHNMPESSADTVAYVNTHPNVVYVKLRF